MSKHCLCHKLLIHLVFITLPSQNLSCVLHLASCILCLVSCVLLKKEKSRLSAGLSKINPKNN